MIWDLDGTLIDSYDSIVESLMELLRRHGLCQDRAEILEYVKRKSVHEYLKETGMRLQMEFPDVKQEYSRISSGREEEAREIPGAKDTLAALEAEGTLHFVYTHRGDSASAVLGRLGMRRYFREIVTGSSGFRRKPDPQAIDYLREKYGLDRAHTYYVGDRDIDVQCARNAGVKSILLTGPYCRCEADYAVGDLREIPAVVNPL